LEDLKLSTVDSPTVAIPPPPQALVHKVIREPLLHFFVAGTVLFGMGTYFDHSQRSTGSLIRVSAPEIQQMRELWTRQWGRAPDSSQMKSLVDEYIHQEVLYRAALASGLDKDDTIIRRRLVQKMEFLTQDVASQPPSESELQEHFQRRHEKFVVPAQVAFEHAYFSVSTRGREAERDAKRVLPHLGSRPASAGNLEESGDPFILQSEYPLQTEQQIKELFGQEFASRLFQLKTGVWAGPIRSAYGFHLVRISQKLPPRMPDLAEVYKQVLTDYENERMKARSEAFYQNLRKEYRLEVDAAAVETAESQPPPNNGDGAQGRELAGIK
jgi:peptidyl-prolyl cis-trans isomerase C